MQLSQLALVDYFIRGGIFMWPLLICSLTGLTLILYKAWDLHAATRGSLGLIDQVSQLVKAGDAGAALRLAGSSRTAAGAVMAAVLGSPRRTRAAMQQEAQMAGAKQIALLEFGLPTLSMVVTVSPLLGFLGTVSGMIHAFEAIAARGLGDPSVVASGIAEALITTAAGLIIAIPCFVAHGILVSRVNAIGLGMELAGSQLLQLTAGED